MINDIDRKRMARGTVVPRSDQVSDEFSWRIRPRRDGELFVVMEGAINEKATFDELAPDSRRVVLNLLRVRRVSSEGLARFVAFVRRVSKSTSEFVAECCSVAVVERLNQVPELAQRLRVYSLVAPLECPACNAEAETRLKVSAERGEPNIPWYPCAHCGAGMVLASPRDRYFAFLSESYVRHGA